ncbi:MAG: alginate O-acetyltransferase AlgX-related protein [Acidimicrobiales bacterium]
MADPDSSRTWPLTSLIALLGFVFVPAVMTVAGLSAPGDNPPGEVENSPDGLAFSEGREGSLGRIDRWVESRVPGRELAFEFDRTTTRILDDNYTGAIAANDRVQLGSDGWLFLKDATHQPCATPAQEQEWAAEIGRVEFLVDAAGKQPLIAIAPDRATIVPELLGEIENACQVQNRKVVKRLAESSNVLDLASAVEGEAHALQIDTHWSPTGALAGAELLVETILPGTWEERTLTSDVVERRGDLDGLLGYENTESVNLLTIEQPTPTTLNSLPTSIAGRPLVQATTPGASPHHLLLVHDSYGGYSLEDEPTSYLAGLATSYVRPWFNRVDNVRIAGLDADSIGEDVVTRSLNEADTFAFLFVQRTLPVRLQSGSLSGPLAAALVDRLGVKQSPDRPTATAGVLILDGWGASAPESIQIDTSGGAVQRRIDYPDRIVVAVDAGTSLVTSSAAESWRFVATES